LEVRLTVETLDADLAALAEARAAARRAKIAADAFAGATQEEIDRIVAAMAAAAADAAADLARLAVDETGYGVYEDKILKNLYNADFCAKSMVGMRTKGVLWVDEPGRMTAIGSPVGVIAAIIPVTNPTSTVIFKCLAAVKAGNSVVHAPHPRAVKCCSRTAEIMGAAAVKSGAPKDIIQCLTRASVAATGELMRHPDTALIMATGGAGMVRAAYQAGKPCLAVGAGNVPVYVHRSVPNLDEAALMVVTSKSFDNGTACVAEQTVVIDGPIYDRGIEAFRKHGTAMLSNDEQARLADVIFDERGGLRAENVGQSAKTLAQRAGISVPDDTRVLGAELDVVGPANMLSAEILGPVLSFYRAEDLEAGIARCREILAFGGEGHTLGIHAGDADVVARLSELPASRIPVNTPSLFGGMGYSTEIGPSFMLGTGTWSGSIVSDNVSPLHLINIKRVAYESRPWRGLYGANVPAHLGTAP
jgi:acetaldehyde dehydrogenase (acetylating)